MRNRLLLSAALLAIGGWALFAAPGYAQGVLTPEVSGGILVGPVGGINAVAYNSSEFATLQSEPNCFTAQNGSGIAPWGGLTVEIPLTSEMQNFIIGEVLYDSKSSPFSAKNGSIKERPTKIDGVEALGSVSTKLNADLAYLLFNIAYKYNFTNGPTPVGLGIQIGPSVGLRLRSNFNKTVTVTASSGKPEAPQGTDTQTLSQPVDGAQSIRIGIRGLVSYDIALTESWVASPVAGYDFGITQVDNSRGWRAGSGFGGVAVRYLISM